MKIYTPVKTNFIYPEILPEHYRFGSGQIIGTPLREDGDWRAYLPPEEAQNIRGIESSACYIEAQQHAIATIEEETYDEIDNNYSARFNALLSDGTEQGGDPIKGADSIRHDGLVKDSSMPFANEIQSWDDFHSWKGVNEKAVRAEGKKYNKSLAHDIVFEREDFVDTKYKKLRQALKFCPPPVSVTAWYQDDDGVYIKPEGSRDNHLVELVYIDEDNHPYIRDTYPPYLKKLDSFYDFDFGMRWTISKKKEQSEKSWFQNILDFLNEIFYEYMKRRY